MFEKIKIQIGGEGGGRKGVVSVQPAPLLFVSEMGGGEA